MTDRGTVLLNDDGRASIATLVMLSHHAFRRDAASFEAALQELTSGDAERAGALLAEWKSGARDFPPPATDEEVEMYAQGFAWSCHGIAPEVLESVFALLPARLTERLPAARAAFATRSERAFGAARTGASRTSIPDWL